MPYLGVNHCIFQSTTELMTIGIRSSFLSIHLHHASLILLSHAHSSEAQFCTLIIPYILRWYGFAFGLSANPTVPVPTSMAHHERSPTVMWLISLHRNWPAEVILGFA